MRQPSLRNLQPQEVSVSRSKSPPAGMGTVASPPPSKASTLTAALLAGWDGRGLRERRKCPACPTASPGGAACHRPLHRHLTLPAANMPRPLLGLQDSPGCLHQPALESCSGHPPTSLTPVACLLFLLPACWGGQWGDNPVGEDNRISEGVLASAHRQLGAALLRAATARAALGPADGTLGLASRC